MKGIRGLKAIALAIVATVLPSVSMAVGRLGFSITECKRDSNGILVKWETDQEPPYCVGVFRVNEWTLGRQYPYRYAETHEKTAYLSGDFTRVGVFVQVGAKGSMDFKRELRKDEWESQEKWVHDADGSADDRYEFVPEWMCYGSHTNFTVRPIADGKVRNYDITNLTVTEGANGLVTNTTHSALVVTNAIVTTSDGGSPRIVNNLAPSLIEPTRLCIFGKNTWEGYVKDVGAGLRFKMDGEIPVRVDTVTTNEYTRYNRKYDVVNQKLTNEIVTNHFTRVVTNYTYVGRTVASPYMNFPADNQNVKGWRVIWNADNGAFLAERAYSRRIDRSDELLIPRGFVSFSSHDGYIRTVDDFGREFTVPSPNTDDDLFYTDGLRTPAKGWLKQVKWDYPIKNGVWVLR